MQYQTVIRLCLSAVCAISFQASALAATSQDSAKAALITTMYQQDIKSQGVSSSVLAKFASPKLAKALKLEQDYFDKSQMICGTDSDVIWDSQDPDYVMPKISAANNKIKAQLSHGSDVYFDFDCKGDNCQIADVTLGTGESLSKTLTQNCA